MKNFLLVGPKEHFPTDGVTIRGIKHLLGEAVGPYKSHYLYLDDHKEMVLPEKKEDYDALVVCGSPWIWHGFKRSWKWKNLKAIKNWYGAPKMLGMGLGSCFEVKEHEHKRLISNSDIKEWNSVFDGLNFLRDSVIGSLVDGKKAPCPSFYSCEFVDEPREYNTVFLYCPEIGVSAGTFDKSKLRQWYHDFNYLVNNLVDKSLPTFYYVVLQEEKERWQKMGFTQAITVLHDENHTIDASKKASHVVSGRVHCAIPAAVQGAKVTLASVDTRFLTWAEWSTNKIEAYKQKYVQFIQGYLNDE